VPGTCVTVTLEGRRPLVVEIQALVNPAADGRGRRAVSDLDSARVSMLLAVLARHGRLPIEGAEVYAATVGGLAAVEPAADLGLALALASAVRDTPVPATVCAIGEVSLSGDVRRVPAIGRRLAEAARLGFSTALLPSAHLGDVIPPGPAEALRLLPVATIGEALGQMARLGDASAPRRPTLRRVDEVSG